LEQDFVQGRPLVKEVFQAKLKLPCERALMQFLAIQELLAEEEVDSPLPGLMFQPGQWVIEPLEDLMALVGWGNSSLASLVLLSEQGVIESLMKIKFPLRQVAQPWMDLLVGTLGRPRVDPLLFLLQMPDQE
jgi:hypothetical protein